MNSRRHLGVLSRVLRSNVGLGNRVAHGLLVVCLAGCAARPAPLTGEALRNLDSTLSFAHSALNALLLHARAPAHDPRDFESFYDVVGVPFRDLV